MMINCSVLVFPTESEPLSNSAALFPFLLFASFTFFVFPRLCRPLTLQEEKRLNLAALRAPRPACHSRRRPNVRSDGSGMKAGDGESSLTFCSVRPWSRGRASADRSCRFIPQRSESQVQHGPLGSAATRTDIHLSSKAISSAASPPVGQLHEPDDLLTISCSAKCGNSN